MGLNGALYSIPFQLICNMTKCSKKMFSSFDPSQEGEGVCENSICACMVLHLH